MNTINCQHCGKEFSARRSDAKFCSNACRQLAYLDRGKSYWENEKQASQQEKTSVSENEALAALRNELKEMKEARFAEAKKTREALALAEIEELKKRIDTAMEKIRMDSIKEAIDKTNGLLKKWITQLLEFDRQEETPLYKVQWLCNEILHFEEFDRCKLPDSYEHMGFIANILVPKVKSWNDEIRYRRDEYINVQLSKDLKNELANILTKI